MHYRCATLKYVIQRVGNISFCSLWRSSDINRKKRNWKLQQYCPHACSVWWRPCLESMRRVVNVIGPHDAYIIYWHWHRQFMSEDLWIFLRWRITRSTRNIPYGFILILVINTLKGKQQIFLKINKLWFNTGQLTFTQVHVRRTSQATWKHIIISYLQHNIFTMYAQVTHLKIYEWC